VDGACVASAAGGAAAEVADRLSWSTFVTPSAALVTSTYPHPAKTSAASTLVTVPLRAKRRSSTRPVPGVSPDCDGGGLSPLASV
jgi:hypothetical protein